MPAGPAIDIIGAAIGSGAPQPGCEAGPQALRAAGLAQALTVADGSVQWVADVADRVRSAAAADPSQRLAALADFSPRLAEAVAASCRAGRMPVIVGGDHGSAVGTWSGVALALGRDQPPGLVWIDAHLDAHTPDSSASRMPHGMPLAALLGEGPAALAGLGGWAPKLQPRHVVVVGARSWEAAERARLDRLGVRVIAGDALRGDGLAAALAQARAVASAAPGGWGLSIDLDALDPSEVGGFGSPEPGGPPLAALAAALTGWGHGAGLRAVELAEYNPRLDADGRGARAALALLAAVFTPGGATG